MRLFFGSRTRFLFLTNGGVLRRPCNTAFLHSSLHANSIDPQEDGEPFVSQTVHVSEPNNCHSAKPPWLLPSHRRLLLSAASRLALTAPGSQLKLFDLLANSKSKRKSLTLVEIVDESLRVYQDFSPSSVKTLVCNELVRVLVQAGHVCEACKVFDRMSMPNSSFFLNKKSGDVVFSAVMGGVIPILKGIGEERFVKIVSKVYELGALPLSNSGTLTCIICTLCKDRRTGVALGLLNSLISMGAPLEAPPCNALLTGLARMRDYDKMSVFFEQMKRASICPDVITFGILINNFCKQWKIDAAMAVLESMGEASVKPDVVTFNMLVDGLCKVGRPEEALSLSHRMVDVSSGCTPDTITYNSLIGGFFHSGQFEKSWEIFRRMGGEGARPNVVTLNTMVDGMCRQGRVSSAVQLMREMSGNGIRANVVTYTCLIRAFCEVNNIGKAMEIFTEMCDSRCSPDAMAYHTMIFGLTHAGMMDEANDILSRMKKDGFYPDVVGYNTLVAGFCRKSKTEEAYGILKEMEEVGVIPDSVTYNTLISYFSKKGDMDMTLTLLEKMRVQRLIPTVVTYGAVIGGYCRQGAIHEAVRIFEQMSSDSNVMPNTAIFNMIIDAHCRDGKMEAALSLLEDMRKNGVRICTTTYNSVFEGLRESNMLGKALELMDRMNEEACVPDYVTVGVLTKWLSAAGESQKLKFFLEGSIMDSSV